jgi:hypothetical protein
MNQTLPDDSSGSYNYSSVPYDERDALRFKAEHDESRHELGEISKKACIAELSGRTSANSCWQPSMVYSLD